jgi:chemotaxis family two-component system response regulator Rcp1
MSPLSKPVQILLVESNPGDARLTLEALNNGNGRNGRHNLSIAQDGLEALAFLRREGHYSAVPRPDIILLELNLPNKDGRELLAEVKQDPALRRIPVVVLTNSNTEQDIHTAYHLHANCYFVKPAEVNDFISLIRVIEDFWLAVVKLPER